MYNDEYSTAFVENVWAGIDIFITHDQ